jgi:two-component system, response regulator YesN
MDHQVSLFELVRYVQNPKSRSVNITYKEWVMDIKILVADDDFDDRSDVKQILKTVNCEVMEVDNGEKALAEILYRQGDRPYDLLITDIKMPLLNGIELIELLHSKFDSFPVLVVSGSIGLKEKNRLAKFQCLELLEKPVIEERLLKKIYLLLGKRSFCI